MLERLKLRESLSVLLVTDARQRVTAGGNPTRLGLVQSGGYCVHRLMLKNKSCRGWQALTTAGVHVHCTDL